MRIRELQGDDIALGHAAMFELRGQRPALASAQAFQDWVTQAGAQQGYRLAASFGDAAQAQAVCGFRVLEMLYSGRQLYIDDLSTLPAARGRGHARALLAWAEAEARRARLREPAPRFGRAALSGAPAVPQSGDGHHGPPFRQESAVSYYDPRTRNPAISRRPLNRQGDDWIRALLARLQLCRISTLWVGEDGEAFPFVNPTSFVYRPETHDIVYHSNLAGRLRANTENSARTTFEASEIRPLSAEQRSAGIQRAVPQRGGLRRGAAAGR